MYQPAEMARAFPMRRPYVKQPRRCSVEAVRELNKLCKSKSGNSFSIGDEKNGIVIAEGYASDGSIMEATGRAVTVAFDAGNLLKVAVAKRAKWPNAPITIAADNDAWTDGNPGTTKAREAALAIGASLAIPVFDHVSTKPTDFNDLHKLQGLDAVRAQIERAVPIERGEDTKQAAEVFKLYAPSNPRGSRPLDENAWSEPQPLAAKVEPEPYPIDALPISIRAAVEEVAAFVKAPLPMVASSALAALSLAIQAYADAKRAEKLSGPVGLFLLTIADSGERKSTCDGFFTKAIRDYEEAQAQAAKPLLKDHQAALEAWSAKYAGIKERIRQFAKVGKPTAPMEAALRELQYEKPEAPRIPRLLYADATPEALAFSLAKQWPSGGVVSAEGGIVFGSHGMGKDSVMRNLSMLNQLWDGTNLTIDRRTSESFTVRGARLTIALQVQEPTLREFFTRSGPLARGTGFLARFLVAWPESTQGLRPFTEAPDSWPHLAAFNRRIAAILNQPAPIDDDGALTPAMLIMTHDAKAAWVEFHDEIERRLVSGGELFDVRDVASKSADNATRLAALFQTFEGGGGAIGVSAFESASRIAAWHLQEAQRFLGELALPPELANAARLDTWLIAHCRRERTHLVPIAKLQQFGPGGLRSKAGIETAMRELEELGRARWARDGRRKMIKVNPKLLGSAP